MKDAKAIDKLTAKHGRPPTREEISAYKQKKKEKKEKKAAAAGASVSQEEAYPSRDAAAEAADAEVAAEAAAAQDDDAGSAAEAGGVDDDAPTGEVDFEPTQLPPPAARESKEERKARRRAEKAAAAAATPERAPPVAHVTTPAEPATEEDLEGLTVLDADAVVLAPSDDGESSGAAVPRVRNLLIEGSAFLKRRKPTSYNCKACGGRKKGGRSKCLQPCPGGEAAEEEEEAAEEAAAEEEAEDDEEAAAPAAAAAKAPRSSWNCNACGGSKKAARSNCLQPCPGGQVVAVDVDEDDDESDAPPAKKAKKSAYNVFMKEEVVRVKQAQPSLSHQEAFAAAAANWQSAAARQKGNDCRELVVASEEGQAKQRSKRKNLADDGHASPAKAASTRHSKTSCDAALAIMEYYKFDIFDALDGPVTVRAARASCVLRQRLIACSQRARVLFPGRPSLGGASQAARHLQGRVRRAQQAAAAAQKSRKGRHVEERDRGGGEETGRLHGARSADRRRDGVGHRGGGVGLGLEPRRLTRPRPRSSGA